ncbi:MAG: type I methionyl aminopeptidase [Clostridia bacterium]|nr:type I methionyl aminopeptidase [Clostridia bacterium]
MIRVKSEHEIEKMRSAGRIVAETFEMLSETIKPGVTTKELNALADEFIKKNKATCSFYRYNGYPASICTSVNEQVVHGIPSGSVALKAGDIVSIDIGACYEGYHGDAARTFAVGTISSEAQKLIDVTKQSFFEGMSKAIPGNRIGDIANAVQSYVESNGFSVVRALVGHGVGAELHEAPEVPNFGTAGRGVRLVSGMTIAIEPMVNMGTYHVNTLSDGWTVVTADKKLSAHYENSVVVTAKGPEILTKC